MDSVSAWRDTIERILTAHAAIPYANVSARTMTVFDRARDHYLLVDDGWRGTTRIHGTLVHVDIIDEKIWIQYDGTEYGIANELIDAGVSKERIVLGFQPPSVRPHTGFAA